MLIIPQYIAFFKSKDEISQKTENYSTMILINAKGKLMTDVNQKIMERASGNRVLNPDEQRRYLGTFKERVLVTITNDDIYNQNILPLFSQALDETQREVQPVKVTISSKIASDRQIALLTAAKQRGLAATIMDNKDSNSPYSVVIYTDHAVNRPETDILALFHQEAKETESKPSKGFLKRLFGI